LACELKGYLKDGDALKELSIRISNPVAGDLDSFCLVHVSPILDQDRAIHGIDQEQAFSLARFFVRSLLEGANVVDDRNMPLDLDSL
jgi:hypothetical protein